MSDHPFYTVQDLRDLLDYATRLGFHDDADYWREQLIERGETP